ncbi:hypothetical protein Lepto7376_1807 [[Leptolyngbya] sp. PCC 7376]|uniref:hypothetical protein n=1 Tax=[Leptolyngbya] sp. PCC 7376 TaxID=111781 RepID=UPI00029F365F|nr:hypothetical protein [[Leptolyngbya] sp. PCC 7376]AFY38135.1 hypothetical protein Lepto7376_1807 [[Leptolyngbya] sp. PCC 7376]
MFRPSQPSSHSKNTKVDQSGRSPIKFGFSTGGNDGSFPIDLIRFSIQAEQRKPRKQRPSQNTYISPHAAPLISINRRDVTTLDELFLRDDITEIANEISIVLEQILPTPCWEDDPFDVVKILI